MSESEKTLLKKENKNSDKIKILLPFDIEIVGILNLFIVACKNYIVYYYCLVL